MTFTARMLILSTLMVIASTQRTCCNALEAKCDACKKGMSVKRFCLATPQYKYRGCEDWPIKTCCNALEAKCDACKKDMSVKRFCLATPQYKYRGCKRYQRPWWSTFLKNMKTGALRGSTSNRL